MDSPGELAIVLHTHMPYVEGFGTWPFGEEWLWEAAATSYVPLPAGARRDRKRRQPHEADAVADAGAVRPAGGAGGDRTLHRVPAGDQARVAPARHRGLQAGRRRRRGDRAGALGRRLRRRRRQRSSGSNRTAAIASGARPVMRAGPPRRPTRSCRCWCSRTHRAATAVRHRLVPATVRGVGWRLLAAGVRVRAMVERGAARGRCPCHLRRADRAPWSWRGAQPASAQAP